MKDNGLLVDTHCHLNFDAFEVDLEAVLQRAREAGINRILIPGIDLETSRSAVDLASRYEHVYCAVGIHPHHAKDWEDSSYTKLAALASSPHCVAIGETGLDYYRNISSPAAQRNAFQAQLSLAAELGLPVVIHNRDADEEMLPIVVGWAQGPGTAMASAGRAGVLHAYSADEAMGQKVVQEGFFIGIAGPITYKNAESRRRITAQLPLDRLLLETDAPYLTPAPYRGKRNEPAHVRLIADQLAAVQQATLEATAKQTTANAAELFGWYHGEDDNALL